MKGNKHLITTAIAYGNASPHIGHAFEFVTADTLSRFHRLIGGDVYFITGMDEHGQKIERKAKEQNIPVQEFVDIYAKSFIDLDAKLSVVYDFFVRTSDKAKHYQGAQHLWKKLVDAKTIEKRSYKALYCVGCEEFKTEKDLNEKGECPLHLVKPEIVEEENYFFTLSQFTDKIKEKISSDELKIYPESRKNEIMALLERGLGDVSFSRPKSKVTWGIPVPEDDTQVMYVWCDALSNYLTAIGYGTEHFDKDLWVNTTHIIGKDILRFHAAIWPAMLLAADLPLPKRILVHGFITSHGQKMSKTLGNVIDPQELLQMFDSPAGELAGEALRFILLHEVPSFEDGDVTMETIRASYTAHLANGIGNLTSRIMKMAISNAVRSKMSDVRSKIQIQEYDTNGSLKKVMSEMRLLDEYIATNEPFKVIKVDMERGKEMIVYCLVRLEQIVEDLSIFMPKTSAKILECIRENKMPEKPLFGRLA